MAHENAPDLPVEGWLKTLGIDSLIQWDVLGFVYRHRTSLIGAEAIARLLGYTANDPVLAALDALESLGFVERSRATRGVRLYQFALPPDLRRRDSFERLMAWADTRAGRLRLFKMLRSTEKTTPEGHQVVQSAVAHAMPFLPMAKLLCALTSRPSSSNHKAEEGGELCQKAS